MRKRRTHLKEPKTHVCLVKKKKRKKEKKPPSIFTRGTRSEHVVKAVNVTLTRKLWTQSEDFNFPALSQRMILEVWRSRSHRESGCSQCEASPPLTPTPRSICRFTATSYSRQEFGLLCPYKIFTASNIYFSSLAREKRQLMKCGGQILRGEKKGPMKNYHDVKKIKKNLKFENLTFFIFSHLKGNKSWNKLSNYIF